MKIEHKIVDEEKGIVQITTQDERWYKIEEDYLPSVTWIAGYYPSAGLTQWRVQLGQEEADRRMIEAAGRGSKVHKACEMLLLGETIKHDDLLYNPNTKNEEEITSEEWEAIMSFKNWYSEQEIEVIKTETLVYNKELRYAGTVDLVARIADQVYIIDFKTSKDIHPQHKIQLSAYKEAFKSMGAKTEPRLAILQLGYKRNKKGFRFTEIEDCFPLFLAVSKIWENEVKQKNPLQREYPLEIKL